MTGNARNDVAIVGPGRVGTALAAALAQAGHRVVAVGGGSDGSRQRFAARIAGVPTSADPAEAVRAAGLVLLCVPDGALEGLVAHIARSDAVRAGARVVHVAGALGIGVLRRAELAGARVAACHPAQTFPSGEVDLDRLVGTAWGVTARPDDRAWARALVTDLGGEPFDVPDDRRVLYHAGLAMASGGAGAAVALARQALLAARVADPARMLAPLAEASVANALERGAEALTGPVARGDVGTVRRHLDQLDADAPSLADSYRRLSRVVLDLVRPALAASVAADVAAALAPDRQPQTAVRHDAPSTDPGPEQ